VSLQSWVALDVSVLLQCIVRDLKGIAYNNLPAAEALPPQWAPEAHAVRVQSLRARALLEPESHQSRSQRDCLCNRWH